MTNRNNIGSVLESIQKDFISYYNRKCSELSLSKDDQAGVVTFGFLALGTTRGGVKWATKSYAQKKSMLVVLMKLKNTVQDSFKNR